MLTLILLCLQDVNSLGEVQFLELKLVNFLGCESPSSSSSPSETASGFGEEEGEGLPFSCCVLCHF